MSLKTCVNAEGRWRHVLQNKRDYGQIQDITIDRLPNDQGDAAVEAIPSGSNYRRDLQKNKRRRVPGLHGEPRSIETPKHEKIYKTVQRGREIMAKIRDFLYLLMIVSLIGIAICYKSGNTAIQGVWSGSMITSLLVAMMIDKQLDKEDETED